MNTQEHLNRIKAKCQELLAIAEKITIQHAPHAQAGWKATIAAIDTIIFHPANGNDEGRLCLCSHCQMLNTIIAAWPPELLQKS
jgi:hypothetical protein